MKKQIALILFLSSTSAFAAEISVNDYLEQVRSQSPNYKASQLNAEGESRQTSAASIITSPYLFANYVNLDNHEEQVNPAFSGDRTQGRGYSVGLAMRTPIGLNARYSFNLAHTTIHNAQAAFLPVPDFYTAYNKIELTQSLFRNSFGAETRALQDAQKWRHEAASLGEEFQLQLKIVEAENVFYRLAFARRGVQVQESVIGRAEKVLTWAKRRVSNQLGDRTDLLQAQASYDLRRLELQNALEEERHASRSFNLLRNSPGDQVSDVLQLPSIDQTLKMEAAARKAARLDVQAAEAQLNTILATTQLDKESVKPTVDVFADVAWNGRDAKRSPAVRESQRSVHNTTRFGLNLNIPLAVGAVTNAWKGINMTQEGARLSLEHKRLTEDKEWRGLSSQLVDARNRLQLLRQIEEVQRDKFEHERQRLLRGRTTTYQALSFEQDYAQSQLLSLRTQAEVLQLLSQLKLFRGEQ